MIDPPLLTVTSAHVYAGEGPERRTIVAGVDLVLERGGTLGIVGESGSGKSMLMKAVLGLLPRGTSHEGEIVFEGERIDNLPEAKLRPLRGRRISLLLQDPFTMLNPLQTVGDTIAESLRPEDRSSRNATRAAVAERLLEVGLNADIAAKRPFQLSGGMRQRVAVAAALAANPDLLIADEPTTALDAASQLEVLELITSLQHRRRMALILITHDLRVAFDVCDQVMVMYAGRVLEQAPVHELQTSPKHPYTAGLLAAEPRADSYTGTLQALAGSVPNPDSVADQCSFADRCHWAQAVCLQEAPPLIAIGPDSSSPQLSRCTRIGEIEGQLVAGLREATEADRRPEVVRNASSLLTVTELSKTFTASGLVGGSTSHLAIDSVTFEVAEGEAVGLVGESGSGKTTIARSILGLTTADSGRIMLDGRDISRYRSLSREEARAVRRTVQVVFQDPYSSLNPSMTIGRILREEIEIRGKVKDVDAEIGAALERVSLPTHYAARLPAALSGGERQRVSIARAICLKPRLLICDEPVAALDVSVQAQILELLRGLSKDLGMATLFITHDLAVVRQMTERIIVLNRGHIVEAGPTDSVLDHPQDAYTKMLVAAVPGQTPRSVESPTIEPKRLSDDPLLAEK